MSLDHAGKRIPALGIGAETARGMMNSEFPILKVEIIYQVVMEEKHLDINSHGLVRGLCICNESLMAVAADSPAPTSRGNAQKEYQEKMVKAKPMRAGTACTINIFRLAVMPP